MTSLHGEMDIGQDTGVPSLTLLCVRLLSKMGRKHERPAAGQTDLFHQLPPQTILDILECRHDEAKAGCGSNLSDGPLVTEMDDAFIRRLLRRWDSVTPSELAACHQNFSTANKFTEQDMEGFAPLWTPLPGSCALGSLARPGHPGLSTAYSQPTTDQQQQRSGDQDATRGLLPTRMTEPSPLANLCRALALDSDQGGTTEHVSPTAGVNHTGRAAPDASAGAWGLRRNTASMAIASSARTAPPSSSTAATAVAGANHHCHGSVDARARTRATSRTDNGEQLQHHHQLAQHQHPHQHHHHHHHHHPSQSAHPLDEAGAASAMSRPALAAERGSIDNPNRPASKQHENSQLDNDDGEDGVDDDDDDALDPADMPGPTGYQSDSGAPTRTTARTATATAATMTSSSSSGEQAAAAAAAAAAAVAARGNGGSCGGGGARRSQGRSGNDRQRQQRHSARREHDGSNSITSETGQLAELLEQTTLPVKMCKTLGTAAPPPPRPHPRPLTSAEDDDPSQPSQRTGEGDANTPAVIQGKMDVGADGTAEVVERVHGLSASHSMDTQEDTRSEQQQQQQQHHHHQQGRGSGAGDSAREQRQQSQQPQGQDQEQAETETEAEAEGLTPEEIQQGMQIVQTEKGQRLKYDPVNRRLFVLFRRQNLKFKERRRFEEIHLHRCKHLKRHGLCVLVDHPLSAFSFTHARLSATFFVRATRNWAPTLMYLDISGCSGVRNHQIFNALAQLHSLRVLNISDTKLKSLPPLRRLEVLHAEGSRLESKEVVGLSQHSRYLRELYLQMTDVGVDISSALCTMPHLEALGITACSGFSTTQQQQLFDAAYAARAHSFFDRHIFELATQKLRWLDVSFTPAPPGFVRRAIDRFPSLEYLGAMGTNAQTALPSAIPSHLQLGCSTSGRKELIQGFLQLPLMLPANDLRSTLRSIYMTTPRDGSPDGITDELAAQLLKRLTEVLWYRMVNSDIVLVTTAILYYVLQLHIPHASVPALRRDALCACKRVLKVHENAEQLVKNVCLILWNFNPWRELAEFAVEIASSLMKAAVNFTEPTIRMCAFGIVCRDLASLSPPMKEKLVGEAGVMDSMLNFLLHHVGDGVSRNQDEQRCLESCWTFMWNVTDESAVCCRHAFTHPDCIRLVFTCCNTAPLSTLAMKRNVMGFLANVSEVPDLRPSFFAYQLVPIIVNTVDSTNEIEVTYNATGILCNLASCAELWRSDLCLDLDATLDTVRKCVDQWLLSDYSKINYRSLRPILRLMDPALHWVQNYWACSALLNLCYTFPDRYCPMALQEGAKIPLQGVVHARKDPNLTLHAEDALKRLEDWERSDPEGMSAP